MAYAVVTGASKGLGKAAASKLIQNHISLIAVSRSENEDLKKMAEEQGTDYRFYPCDLSNPEETERTFNEIADFLFANENEIIYLIHNAGIVEPIDRVGRLESHQVQKSIQINLTSPITISDLFIRRAEGHSAELRIMNITSGAGERPVHGWSIYGSTKAALNLFTQAAALEAENRGANIKINAFSPGIMDTDMQGVIRSSSKESFNDVETFQNYKDQDQLRSPETVAGCLVDVMLSQSIINGKIYYIKDLL
ncbi:(S)-benzoin forming benzil reductase [Peribacillus kribbensis]|uniref:(S)-benzoin forming benzil reductase n=1 Tax=Peribacillus kribbensis TaxID=356658 RepID=UPI00040D322B|nr:(S)-benzoin forming benzil reductase [Peribacillus kribbensis]